MQLKKCLKCKEYTLLEECKICKTKTINPHYKFKEIKDAPRDSSNHFLKKRKKN